MRDITDDLSERMAKLQEELEVVKRRRQEMDAIEQDIEQRLGALKTALEWERVLQGVSNGKTRWVGVDVAEAVQQLLLEHPNWTHAKIRDHMIADGFDFKGKNPGLSVNMALQRVNRGLVKSA